MAIGQLTNTQIEILKTFSYQLSNNDLKELKEMLSTFFAQKAIKGADKVWEEKGWSNETMDDFLNKKLRKK